LATRAALWGVNEIVSLLLASLIAGLATTPYAAYHFHRLAPYGVIANLLAMPVVSAWVMPMGILGVIAFPFRFDAFFWRQMGYGIEWMDRSRCGLRACRAPSARHLVRDWAAFARHRRPSGYRPSQDTVALERRGLCGAGAGARRTHAGAGPVLVAADGSTFAVRGANGKLAFHRPAAIRLRRANGSPPTPTAAMSTTKVSATASPAIRSAVSASSPMAAPCPMPSRPMPSKRIAAAPPLS
jgi:competence protein ComEC